MRATIHYDRPLTPGYPDHEHGRELAAMDEILAENLRVFELVQADLIARGSVSPLKGRPAMSADQVLRVVVIKQMGGYSYRKLAFHLMDSISYQTFARLGPLAKPLKRSALQQNIKKLSAETLEEVNKVILKVAERDGIDKGRKVRIDSATTETNIHYPTDSDLLSDVVRVLTRLLHRIPKDFGVLFSDHTKRAKRRAFGITNAKRKLERVRMYRDLVKVGKKTVGYAVEALCVLDSWPELDVDRRAIADEMADSIRDVLCAAEQVLSQTHRRVFEGEHVPAGEKIVSIFERHTDIIEKKGRDTEFGHKVCYTVGSSGLTLDCVVQEGNPADSSLAQEMIGRQKEIYGRVPLKAAMDGGFASKTNLKAIKDMGVRDVAFNKKRGLNVQEMVKSTWVYKNLTRFRAGVEGCLSFLQRCFGLDRCTWRSFSSFKAYVWSSVLSANLLILARHRIAAARAG